MRKLLIAVLLCSCCTISARADEAAKREKLRDLFVQLHLSDLMKTIMEQSLRQGELTAQTMFGAPELPPKARDVLEDYNKSILALFGTALSWQKLEPAYLDLYASTFTENDVDAMLAFYKSPAGQKMVAKTPEMMTASQQIVASKFQLVQPQFQKITRDFVNRLTEVQKSLPPSGKS